MITVGIDPGNKGCMCVNIDGLLYFTNMPTFDVTVAGKPRTKLDFKALCGEVERLTFVAPALVLIEEVGGLPKESAPHAFSFGYGCGVLFGLCLAFGLTTTLAKPQEWKANMRVPGKGANEGDIVKRADELFPEYTSEWRGPRGGLLLDRAEAALLSAYAIKKAQQS